MHAEEWPADAKKAYVDRCAMSMSSQGLPDKTAQKYCQCFADGMESEFGKSEYDQMMKAQPNPQGDEFDRRLYNLLMSCSQYLPGR